MFLIILSCGTYINIVIDPSKKKKHSGLKSQEFIAVVVFTIPPTHLLVWLIRALLPRTFQLCQHCISFCFLSLKNGIRVNSLYIVGAVALCVQCRLGFVLLWSCWCFIMVSCLCFGFSIDCFILVFRVHFVTLWWRPGGCVCDVPNCIWASTADTGYYFVSVVLECCDCYRCAWLMFFI